MSPLFHAILSFTEVVMESLHDLSPRSLLDWVTPTVVGQTARSQYLPWSLPRPRIGPVRILFGSRIPLFYTLQGIYGVWKLCCFWFPRIWVKLMNLGQILDFKMPGNFTRSIQKKLNPEVNPEMFLNKLSTSFIGRLLMNRGWWDNRKHGRPAAAWKPMMWCPFHGFESSLMVVLPLFMDKLSSLCGEKNLFHQPGKTFWRKKKNWSKLTNRQLSVQQINPFPPIHGRFPYLPLPPLTNPQKHSNGPDTGKRGIDFWTSTFVHNQFSTESLVGLDRKSVV